MMSTRASTDPSDHRTSGEADAEASPGIITTSDETIVWGQGIPIRPSLNLLPPTNSETRPSTSRTISQASVSDAISRLQREKASVQQALDRCKADYKDLNKRFDKLLKE